jgi:hypothetical protein
MTDNSRIKINLNTGEFELEGSEEFVKSQISALPDIIQKVCSILPKPVETHHQIHVEEQNHAQVVLTPKLDNDVIGNIPNNFGEWFNRYPKKLQQGDLVLLTGYFQQKISEDNAFETSEVTNLLKEQGLKLSNPAKFLKSLQESKLAIIFEKRGKLNRFRISPDGESRIKELLQVQ